MTGPRYEAPEFLEVNTGDKQAILPFEEVVNNPDYSSQVVQRALQEVTDWQASYAAFFDRIGEKEMLAIVEAIGRLRENMTDNSSSDVGLDFDADQ